MAKHREPAHGRRCVTTEGLSKDDHGKCESGIRKGYGRL